MLGRLDSCRVQQHRHLPDWLSYFAVGVDPSQRVLPRSLWRKRARMAQRKLRRATTYDGLASVGQFQVLLWRRLSKQAYANLVMLKTCSILVLNLLLGFALAAAEDYPVGDKPFRRYVAKGTDGQRITFYLSTQSQPAIPSR
jgi:hypothetical protein